MTDFDFAFIRNNLSGLEQLDLAGITNANLPNNALANTLDHANVRLNKLTTVTLPAGMTTLNWPSASQTLAQRSSFAPARSPMQPRPPLWTLLLSMSKWSTGKGRLSYSSI